jgi:hypothetical protein
MQIEVRDASVTFLSALRDDTVNKYNAGALPHSDVLRQEVAVSNAVALQVQTVGDYRVAKQKFVELLGYNVPASVSDDLSLMLTTPLEAQPYGKSLETALVEAVQNRNEIATLEKEERLQKEFGDMFVPLLFDVADETSVQLAAEKVDQHLNSARLNCLVNNTKTHCFMALSQ